MRDRSVVCLRRAFPECRLTLVADATYIATKPFATSTLFKHIPTSSMNGAEAMASIGYISFPLGSFRPYV